MRKNFGLIPVFLIFSFFATFMSKGFSQQNINDIMPFIEEGYRIWDTSGPGLSAESGDILLSLITKEDYGGMELVLLRKEKGKLRKIAVNGGLLPSRDELGTGGGVYPVLVDGIIYADDRIGSGSVASSSSTQFEKAADGHYYFKEYHAQTTNYSVEDLFARQRITAAERKKMTFNEATLQMIFEPIAEGVLKDGGELSEEPMLEKLSKYIPEGSRLACYGNGDLNRDGFKEDAVMIVYSDELVQVCLLLQQQDGSYKVVATNDGLFLTEGEGRYDFNANNFKGVVKNGYFTIERRVPVDEVSFQHWYITFKYGAGNSPTLLHRFDVEAYEGFDPKPKQILMELTQKDFGEIRFERMTSLPGIYGYEPAESNIQGILTRKLFYGRPNYGQSPQTDEKLWVYILKTDYPASVFSFNDPNADIESKVSSVTDIREIQVYSKSGNLDFSKLENRKVRLQGQLQPQQTGQQFTKVIMRVDKILN